MSSKNKFGFAPLEPKAEIKRPERSVGPMGAAVRETAENLSVTTEAKMEQRRQNAEDAKAFRAAEAEGRVLRLVPLTEIHTTDLPRDRIDLEAVAASDEMEELKASIRGRGQKEPIEVYADAEGRLQLKKGWRRFTALSQLHAETGDDQFATIIARIETGNDDRLGRYLDMVEENVVREDLTFAEMAQLCIIAAQDPALGEIDPDALVPRLYGSLHKMKRSYIRSFVWLLSVLGDALQWPKEVSRNVGVEVARTLKTVGEAEELKDQLRLCNSPEEQGAVLNNYLSAAKSTSKPKPAREPKEKFEFHVGKMKVTARQGECRIVSKDDFASIPRDRLEKAIKAFEDVLNDGNPRVTSL